MNGTLNMSFCFAIWVSCVILLYMLYSTHSHIFHILIWHVWYDTYCASPQKLGMDKLDWTSCCLNKILNTNNVIERMLAEKDMLLEKNGGNLFCWLLTKLSGDEQKLWGQTSLPKLANALNCHAFLILMTRNSWIRNACR